MIADRRVSRPSRKRIRLDIDEYSQTGAICSITIAVQDRQPIFTNPRLPRLLWRSCVRIPAGYQ